MKNLMYLKNDFVSKKAFLRENSQIGLRQFLSSRVQKILSRGAKILLSTFFSRYADCQLGGGSQENVSIVSARGGGPQNGPF